MPSENLSQPRNESGRYPRRFVLVTCLFAIVLAVGTDAVIHHLNVGERLRRLSARLKGDVAPVTMIGTELPTTAKTVFAPLSISYWKIDEPKENYPAGPMEILDDSTVMLVGKCGDVRTMRLRPSGRSEVLDTGRITGVYCGYENAGVKDLVRVGKRYFASTHVKGTSPNTIEIALVEFTPRTERNGSKAAPAQRTIWQTDEKLVSPIEGTQLGGRLVPHDEHRIWMIIGDNGRADLSATDSSDLGKLLDIDVDAGRATIVAKGFRSPGALTLDARGRLWEAEHGPKGGDEVNLVHDGVDYGWPQVTYGTIYEEERNPAYYGARYGHHDGYEKPAWVWLPSVAPSFIAQYPANGPIEAWRGDLLVSTLRAGTLFRLRVDGDRIAYAEPVLELNHRIREFGFLSNADILLRLETGMLAQVTPGWQP